MTNPTEDETAQVHVRPFADFLREQGAGRTHDELSEALHELVWSPPVPLAAEQVSVEEVPC